MWKITKRRIGVFLASLAVISVPTYASAQTNIRLVHTPISTNAQTDIFALVTNVGDEAFYVPIGTGSSELKVHAKKGPTISMVNSKCFEFPQDFVRLEPSESVLIGVWFHCPMQPGKNTFEGVTTYPGLCEPFEPPAENLVLGYKLPEYTIEYRKHVTHN